MRSAVLKISKILLLLTLLTGFSVIAGWIFDVGALKSVLPNLVTMKVNTAVCFIFASLSALLLSRRISMLFAGIVIVVGLSTLFEYAIAIDLGIDQLIIKEELPAVGTYWAGRMAILTAVNFVLAGTAIVLIRFDRFFHPAEVMLSMAGFIGLINATAYLFQVPFLYNAPFSTHMALHTSVLFIVLSYGILLCRPDRGLTSLVVSNTVGGIMIRRILPAILLLPFLLGWLGFEGGRHGLYSAEFGVSMMILLNYVLVSYVAWHCAHLLNEVDDKRLTASGMLCKVEKELENAKRLSDIGTLAATVAHELRNPLGVIRIAAYNIGKKTKEPSLASHLANIDKKVVESDQIIRNLLSYSKIQAPQREQMLVMDVLADCISHCKNKYAKKNIKIDLDTNCGDKDTIFADPLQMNELFINILDNACQAVPDRDGAVHVNVDANCARSEGKLIVTVTDNGVGIDECDMQNIREPFFSKRAKGIGLGLTVCSQVVRLHEGTLDIQSKKGKGTTVKVTIPTT